MFLFAYGTLMFPEVAGPVAGISNKGQPAVLNGFRRYRVDLGQRRGQFPAIVRDDQGRVEGLLFRSITGEQLLRLDEFEGVADGSYTRELLPVKSRGDTFDAWTYVCGHTLQPRLRGSWDPETFRLQELDWYVQHVVGESAGPEH